MEHRLSLSFNDQQVLRQAYLSQPREVRIPAHILLLLHDGYGYASDEVSKITFTTPDEVENVLRRFNAGGVDAIIDMRRTGPHPAEN